MGDDMHLHPAERESLAVYRRALEAENRDLKADLEHLDRMLTRCDEARERVIAERDRERERADRLEQGIGKHQRCIGDVHGVRADHDLWALLLDSDGDSDQVG